MDRWQPGLRIGDLVLGQKLGQGGMGIVYRAHHPETGGNYAVKRLRRWASRDQHERFLREGLAQAAVDKHPGVLRVRTAGDLDGDPYMVVDLATGGSLSDRLQDGPMPLPEGAALVARLARALAHVHDQGILHRDLKPSNVLFDDAGNPLLVDFGLARLAGQVSLTETGALLGTPAYMSPEQAEGAKAVDARSDVYGLGAVLYHVLTGRAPFTGDAAINVLKKVLADPVAPPSAHRPELPADADTVCLKALAKDPDERYGDAGAMADDLERLARGEPVGAEAPRRPWPRWPLALLLPVLVFGIALGLVEWHDGAAHPPEVIEDGHGHSATVDRTAPVLVLTRPEHGDAVDVLYLWGAVSDEAATVTLVVLAEGPRNKQSVKLTVADIPTGEAGFQRTLELPPWATSLRVHCVDPAGNASRAQFVPDLQRPPTEVTDVDDIGRLFRQEDGSYRIDNLLAIAPGDVRVIPAGTTIAFGPDARASVEGVLWLLGTKDRPVVFEGADGKPWGGLRIQNGGRLFAFHTLLDGGWTRGDPATPRKIQEPGGDTTRAVGLYGQNRGEIFLADCQLKGWERRQGAGLEMENLPGPDAKMPDPSRLTCVGTRFEGNAAAERGGGVLIWGRVRARFRDCWFVGNTAGQSGAGLHASVTSYGPAELHPHVDLLRCAFVGNESGRNGGGAYLGRRARGTLTDCVFRKNTAVDDGGGIAVDPSREHTEDDGFELEAVAFEENTAGKGGGGIFLAPGSWVSARRCSFAKNHSAGKGGGAVFAAQDQDVVHLTLTECRFEGNTAANTAPEVLLRGRVRCTLVRCSGIDRDRVIRTAD